MTDVTTQDAPSEDESSVGQPSKTVDLDREGEVAADFLETLLDIVDMDGDIDVHDVAASHPHASGFVLDGHPPGQQGGRGRTFDWSRIPNDFCRPILLAGGLNAGNVRDAIHAVRPWAADLASGVEASPGIKDAAKLRAFFAAVREADAALP